MQALATGDFASLQQALERALGFQLGVVDRIIVVGRPDGSTLARAGATDADPPMARGERGNEWEPIDQGRLAWAQREMVQGGQVVALAAVQLAFPELEEHLRRAMLLSRGDLGVFIERPISASMLGLSAALVIWTVRSSLKPRKRAAAA